MLAEIYVGLFHYIFRVVRMSSLSRFYDFARFYYPGYLTPAGVNMYVSLCSGVKDWDGGSPSVLASTGAILV